MKSFCKRALLGFALAQALLFWAAVAGQEKSVRPGINKPFENPNVKEFLEKFETESREIFAKRHEIVAACKLKPGMAVADIGAGTGLFTRLFAREVGPSGKVFAVDIAPKFIEHIQKTCREQNLKNVAGIVCKPESVPLPDNSIDLAFICDTYHHFEFPSKTMASIRRALRPKGQLVLIDFHRIEGTSSAWVLNHVRAGQEVFVREIRAAGFKQEVQAKLLTENYFVRFVKIGTSTDPEDKPRQAEHNKAEASIKEQFPLLRAKGMPSLASIGDEMLTQAFPKHRFFVVGFRQYPVAQRVPEPLKIRNLFVVSKDGKVQHITNTKALEEFFRNSLGAVTDEKPARAAVWTWLRLTEEFKQDGFFKFSISEESLKADRSRDGWRASGKAVVNQGGKGEISADLTFNRDGKLTKVEEAGTVKAGVRPICQATKLLDPDPVVRGMAEKDILVMGRAARDYLHEQKAKASPKLKEAINRIWQRIVDAEW